MLGVHCFCLFLKGNASRKTFKTQMGVSVALPQILCSPLSVSILSKSPWYQVVLRECKPFLQSPFLPHKSWFKQNSSRGEKKEKKEKTSPLLFNALFLFSKHVTFWCRIVTLFPRNKILKINKEVLKIYPNLLHFELEELTFGKVSLCVFHFQDWHLKAVPGDLWHNIQHRVILSNSAIWMN